MAMVSASTACCCFIGLVQHLGHGGDQAGHLVQLVVLLVDFHIESLRLGRCGILVGFDLQLDGVNVYFCQAIA